MFPDYDETKISDNLVGNNIPSVVNLIWVRFYLFSRYFAYFRSLMRRLRKSLRELDFGVIDESVENFTGRVVTIVCVLGKGKGKWVLQLRIYVTEVILNNT